MESACFFMIATLQDKLIQGTIPSKIILTGAKIITDQRAPVFNDFRYFPFYYHLGCHLKPKKVLQVGHQMGLVAYVFLKGCRSEPEWFFSINPPGVTGQNVRLAGGCPRLHDGGEQVDLVLMTFQSENLAELKDILVRVWDLLRSGWLVVDYLNYEPVRDAFSWFEKVKNKVGYRLPTYYGTGMIEKI